MVKVNRSKFLYKELINYYPEETVALAIKKNPAHAGIPLVAINNMAKKVINYETNKASAISFAAGISGGIAMASTMPADALQYFGFLIRTMQKLAFLYGFSDFNLDEDELSDDTMNRALVFLGVMRGVAGA